MTAPLKNTLRTGALLAALAAASPLAAQEGAAGVSFVEEFDTLDMGRWYVSDGWNNGAHQNCTWSKKLATVENGLVRHNPGHLAWELVQLHNQRNIRLVCRDSHRTTCNRVET